MAKNKTLLIIIGVAILIFVSVFIIVQNKKQNSPKQAPASGQEKDRESGDGYKYEAQVTIGKNGFVPAKLTVKIHTRVYWKNETGNTLDFQISPSSGGGLETKDIAGNDDVFGTVGKVDQTGGYAYSFHKTGTFRYYNALDPKENGEVEVVTDK